MYNNKPISSDDPKAVEKLQEKLGALEKSQEYMKRVNAYFRKHDTTLGCPGISDEQAAKMDAAVLNGCSWEKMPFASYLLSNNNAEIRRVKKRIEQLTQARDVGFVGWTFPGGEAVINNNINRLQLVFDERPNKDQCTLLKQHGFHWSPAEQAWQRQLNANAIYAASRMPFVCPESGEKPYAFQPKAPKKDALQR